MHPRIWHLWLWAAATWSPLSCTETSCGQDEDQHCLLQSASSLAPEQSSSQDPAYDIRDLRPRTPKRRRRGLDLDVSKSDRDGFRARGNLIRDLGCWPLDPEDEDGRQDATFHDRTCVHYKGPGRCRSGFPFFRFAMPEGMDSRECPRFCMSKGLDMSGIIDIDKKGFECRCGATMLNAAAWQRRLPRRSVLLDFTAKVAIDSPRCRILVFRYAGHFEHGGLPKSRMGINDHDRDYMMSVALGHGHHDHGSVDSDEVDLGKNRGSLGSSSSADGEIDHLLTATERKSIEQKSKTSKGSKATSASMLQANRSQVSMMCADDPAPTIKVAGRTHSCAQLMILCHRPDALGREVTMTCPFTCGLCTTRDAWTPCFPHTCSGGSPWLTQEESGNFIIPYVFDKNVDRVRRDAFVEATKAWEEDTCIRFQQGGNEPRIRVVLEDFSSCYSEIGYPGPKGETKVNLGSCNSQRNIGNIIHELGHSLGMAHEHRRPDAGSRMWLADEKRYVGPYLIFHWENIPPNVRLQYEPDVASYTGSNHQGTGDEKSGYSPYDYGSIMHYSRMNNRFESAQSSVYNNNMGQRNYPSQGDFKQLRDMYQCGGKVRHTSRSKYETTSLWYWLGYDESDIARWSAGVFGNCERAAGREMCYRSRPVHCLDMHGEPVENEHACVPRKRPKDRETCPCSTTCEDTYPTGITDRGVHLSCWQLSQLCYGDRRSEAVREACPMTCDLCGTPEKTVSALSCKDMWPTSLIRPSGWSKDATCRELASLGACHSNQSRLVGSVRSRCPESCGSCPSLPKACADDGSFKDHAFVHEQLWDEVKQKLQ